MRTSLLLVLALVLAAALPATAGDEPFVPILIETPTYLHCTEPTKVQNINSAVLGGDSLVLDDTAPTGSFTAGEGCGTKDTWVAGVDASTELYDFNFSGSHTGNLDAIQFHLWTIDTAASRALNEFQIRATVRVDGELLLDDQLIRGEMVESETGLSRLVEFTLTDVGLLSEDDHLSSHSVDVTIATHNFADGNTINNWVFDAVEVPSGLIFNPESPAFPRV